MTEEAAERGRDEGSETDGERGDTGETATLMRDSRLEQDTIMGAIEDVYEDLDADVPFEEIGRAHV